MTKKPDTEFVVRVLLSLVDDVVKMEACAARVRVQVAALADEHGIKMPKAENV
jgi:hypothetical protein